MRFLRNAALAVLFLAGAARAQIATTTLAAGVNRGDSTVYLASTSGMTPGMILYVDLEAMSVLSVSTGSVSVLAGMSPTLATSHTVGTTVYFGLPSYFTSTAPGGGCPSSFTSIVINLLNGYQYSCVGGSWAKTGGGGGGGVSLMGDLGGTQTAPKVVGIQGVPYSGTAPVDQQCGVYNQAAGQYIPGNCVVVGPTGNLTISGTLTAFGAVFTQSPFNITNPFFLDINGATAFGYSTVAGAVNYLQLGECVTGSPSLCTLSAQGSDTNIKLGLGGKGTGSVAVISTALQVNHLVGSTTTPTCVITGTNAGTGATCTVTGTDMAGEITLTTGTGTIATAVELFELTFNIAYGTKPYMSLTTSGSNANALALAQRPYYIRASSSTAMSSVWAGSTALAVSTVYTYTYVVNQ